MTLNQRFQESAARYPNRPAFRHRVAGRWASLSYADAARRVDALAGGLAARGLQPGERVAIWAENRLEWPLMDLAVLQAGAAVVPLYPTLPDGQVLTLLQDCGAAALVVPGGKLLARAQELRARCPALRHLVAMDGGDGGCVSMADLEAAGAGAPAPPPVDESALAAIVYTSGTTGEMKGVMLTHRNVGCNLEAALTRFKLGPEDEMLSFITLCHMLERMAGLYAPLSVGACIAYADSVMTVARDAGEVCPTAVICVPRFLESVQSRALAALRTAPPLKRRLFHWALAVGRRYHARRRRGRPGLLLALGYRLADRLVLRKVRAALGGRLRFMVCGGAPLPVATAQFFDSAGIPIAEGWGLTETSPVLAVNSPDEPYYGTVGRPVPGVELRNAPDGELICRGPNVMQGYFNRPDATAEAIDADGWFHTGDIGEIDSTGCVRITDRKKNLLVLANGKKVAPAPIEARLKTLDWVSEALLVGDGRSVVGALIVVAGEPFRALAQVAGGDGDLAKLAASAPVRRRLKADIDGLCRDLADWERVKRFALLVRPWTLESGELTPTLKPRRKVILDRCAADIQAMYSGGTGEPS